MELRRTTNIATGNVRYYIDSQRVSRCEYDAAQFWRALSCLRSVTHKNIRRDYMMAVD